MVINRDSADQYIVVSQTEDGVTYCCRLCNFETRWNDSAKRHLLTVHVAPSNEVCPHCNKVRKNARALNKHIRYDCKEYQKLLQMKKVEPTSIDPLTNMQ